MTYGQLKRHRENFEINIYGEGKKAKSEYHNLLTHDPNRIAQVLLDLEILGFPIQKALNIFLMKVKEHDWMGL